MFVSLAEGSRISPVKNMFSEREQEVLFLSAIGASSQAMGNLLGITKRTVETHIATAKEKIGARNQCAATG